MLLEQSGAERPKRAIDPALSATLKIYAGPLVQAGLAEILKDTRFVVAAEQQPDPDDTSCDLLIVDEGYQPNGLTDLLIALKTQHPAARVVVLADQFDFSAMMAARQAGADGFCLTTTSRDVLIHWLELVLLGEIIVPSDLVLALMGDGAHKVERFSLCKPDQPNGGPPQGRRLSCREIEILGWLKEGAPNKVIARKLNLAEATVKVHVKAILRKIGAGNRTQAAIWAADHLPSEGAVQ